MLSDNTTQQTDWSKDPHVIEGLRLASQKRGQTTYLAPVLLADQLQDVQVQIPDDVVLDLVGKVKVWPSMGISSWTNKGSKHNLERAFIVWTLAKGYDLENTQGSGKIYRSDLLGYLRSLDVHPRTARRMAQDALSAGVFEEAEKRGQVFYRLVSQGRAGSIFGCEKVDGRPVWIDAQDLAGGAGKRRAAIWAAYLKLYRGKVISQVTLEGKTGISERSQRNYQKTAGVKSRRNIALLKRPAGSIPGDPKTAQGLKDVTGKHVYINSQGQLVQRLPDSRLVSNRSAVVHSSRGRRKKINSTIKAVSKDLSILGQVEYIQPKIFCSSDKELKTAGRRLGKHDVDQRPAELFLKVHRGKTFTRWDPVGTGEGILL